MTKKYYLGIDLATIQTGWAIAVVENSRVIDFEKGTISFNKNIPLSQRLSGLRIEFEKISQKYPLEPLIIKEQALHDNNMKISAAMFKAHGVVESVFPYSQFIDINPIAVKKFITGNRHASKAFVQRNVCRILNISNTFNNYDESDAVGILLTALVNKQVVIL